MWQRNTSPTFRTTPSSQVRSPDQTPLVDEAEERRMSMPTTALSDKPPVLSATSPPLGPQDWNEKFFRTEVVTLAMKGKILSLKDKDFVVRTVAGEDILKCKAKMVSLHGKKKFVDINGNEMYTLHSKMLAVHKSFRAESPDLEHSFEILSDFHMAGSRPKVVFKNAANGEETTLHVVGEQRNKAAEIRLGDQIVASIGNMFYDPREFFGEKSTYFVAIAPNVDLSMIVGVCVCLDEMDHEASG